MVNIGTDATQFDPERPVIYAFEEIEDATNNFDETRRIGVGGYGTVYFGMLDDKVRKHCIESLMVIYNAIIYFHVLHKNWMMIAILTFRRLLLRR